MSKCPHCGSTAQVTLLDIDYSEEEWSMEVIRYYKCGCGTYFRGTTCYTREGYEMIDKEERPFENRMD